MKDGQRHCSTKMKNPCSRDKQSIPTGNSRSKSWPFKIEN